MDSAIKARLKQVNRKVAKTIEIEDVQLEIRKPTLGDRARVIQQAQDAGEVDANGQPLGMASGLKLLARIAQVLLFDPQTGSRVYSIDEISIICESAWLEDIQEDLVSVFSPSESDAKKK